MTAIAPKIRARVADPAFREEILDLLVALCAVDTTPTADLAHLRGQESKAFELIEAFLAAAPGPGMARLATERRAIDPTICRHPAFSKLHFTKTATRPEGLSPVETYAGRTNLLAFLDGRPAASGRNPALNAHIDVIAPFIPPRRDGDRLHGRGTIDDKGNVAAICAALRIIRDLAAAGEIDLMNKITAMFPVEEETGGNGSLALALDGGLRQRYDSVMVLECADGGIHPGNRGAVWFKCEFRTVANLAGQGGLLYAAAEAILAMAVEGAKIKAESAHPLFPHRPVQTCNGILGPFGEHPSRINGYVKVRLPAATGRSDSGPTRQAAPTDERQEHIRAALERGLAAYIAVRGDKTQVADPATGKPKVERHYDLTATPDGSFALEVHGSTGHMGAILDHDDAILKWAYLAQALDTAKLDVGLSIDHFDPAGELFVEGGQGFLPTHSIEEIQARMRAACICGVRNYLERHGLDRQAIATEVSYDKLHNNAYAGDADSATMQNARRAGIAAGIVVADSPIRGWDVSCDARLFAGQHPDIPVITAGVGALACAHSDHEHLRLAELWPMIEFIVHFLLLETGSPATAC